MTVRQKLLDCGFCFIGASEIAHSAINTFLDSFEQATSTVQSYRLLFLTLCVFFNGASNA